MAILITADDRCREVLPASEKCFTLDELREYVGGWVELAFGTYGIIVVLDEEGKLKGKPINLLATAITHERQVIGYEDWIVGDALICEAKEIE